ncbi:hypothetical protein Gogos_005553 [Gossypium gossypioides]|uniref:Uncharacterized protein n=1 Tax=Gossypium gossypioides TaxID=34282 RepID=A0A7J9CWG6_GOSGO|nr:hypothetical protein [Gossypium gossypioides]
MLLVGWKHLQLILRLENPLLLIPKVLSGVRENNQLL